MICNADKGGSVIVLDTAAYRGEALRQLSDIDIYVPLKSNPTDKYKTILKSLINKWASLGAFTPKETQALVPEFLIVPIFHHLPKDHKGLDPLCGRPIVLGIGSLSEHLGRWMDNFSRWYTVYLAI